MARREVVVLEGDIQGGEAAETIPFAFDGVQYEIDLNEKNAGKLRETFDFYGTHGRRVGGRRTAMVTAASTRAGYSSKAVRTWAASNGVEVPARGRIPNDVLERYRSAGN